MFDTTTNNPRIPAFLRFVIAIECTVVLMGAMLLYLFPNQAAQIWAWSVPPFNSRFVGAIYFTAYVPLLIFWLTARWTPGRFILWLIFVFTTLVMIVMFVHWQSFAWDRFSTYLIFWPLYIFLPINSAVFLMKSRTIRASNPIQMPTLWQFSLITIALVGTGYGIGLLIAPETLAGFWPWKVDAFHGRIYASAFLTPAVGAWILIRRHGAASEYLSFGATLLFGGFLPVLGTLLTNFNVPPERQINYNDLGTWFFFGIFLLTGILGAIQIALALQKSKKLVVN
ncbi:MAG: hypothetical protein KC443_15300 [Anaerolineales bacterium]|nr:hypothetical protein [Anaerolineales bacterium]